MQHAAQGSYAIGWDQVTIDGVAGASMQACRVGRTWRWSGGAIRLDGPTDILRLAEPAVAAALRRHARRAMGRLVDLPEDPAPDDAPACGPALVVTDGRRSWQVDLLPATGGARAIAHFPQTLPPPGTDLWITRADTPVTEAAPAPPTEWRGLSEGTPVATPGGDIAVDRIRPGMEILTPDGAAVTVLRIDTRHLSGARLCALPALAPVRIAPGAFGPGLPRQALLIGPDQDIALSSARVRALFPAAPVTFAARDAVDGRTVTRPARVPGLTAYVLQLARPCPVMASGLALATADRSDAPPLRLLSRGEVAILRGPATPRTLARRPERC